ncbi:MAG: iron complex outermembrane receptor protein [Halieaceae bacterium]|jgi:iron complex outermembrane receptor protein
MHRNLPNTTLRPIVRSTALATALLAAATSSQIVAQESSESRLVMETVLVTARQREESIQDIPLAVTAFDAEAMKRRGIQDLQDVARFTAGFAFEDFDGGNANPVIRGQTTLRTFAREQTVATFLDGVYMPRSWVVDLGTTNLDRIEIVKGPQSARYGRNAFAGAINLIPTKATHEFAADVQGTMGNFDRQDLNAGITVPIVDDVLSVRATFETTESDGSWKNNHPNTYAGVKGGTNGNIGGWDNESYSVDVLFTPTENLTLNASYYGFERREENNATVRLNTGDGTGNCGPLQVGGNPSLYCGEYPVPNSVVTMDPRGFGRQADVDVFRLSADYVINDALSLSYTFGNIDAESQAASPAESDTINCGTILGPPVFPATCNWQGGPSGFIDYDQHELRLRYDNGGKLSGAIGAFYMDGLDESYSVSINLTPRDTAPIDLQRESYGGFANFTFVDQDTVTEAMSAFAEVSYAISEVTRVSVEARLTSEKITTDDNRRDIRVGSETFEFFTPRFTFERDLTADSMLFLTAARGAKAGGFNSNAISPELEIFDPEYNWTYEVGLKNTLMGGRATVNLAAFYTTWEEMQINILDPLGGPFTGTLTANLGDATIWGLEAEGSFLATENLSFDFAASFTEGTYDDGTVDERFTRGNDSFPPPCDGTVCEVGGDIGGNDIERAPDTQLSVGAQWSDQLTAGIDYYVRADVAYQSEFFADPINAASAPDRTVTNATIGFNMDKFALRLWARNLTDEEYVSSSLQIIQATAPNILGTFMGERRTVGATLSYTF